jgi:phosphoserine phosphatase RsbU/P
MLRSNSHCSEVHYPRAQFDAGRELNKLASAQRRFLPQRAPEVGGYELALAYRPAHVVTGDYHDFFKRPDGWTSAFVGDGSGHGPTTSMLVATMRAILWTHPERHTSPGETLTMAGKMFHTLIGTGEFMTGLYIVFRAGGEIAWASAGHDPPLRIGSDGRVAVVDLTPVGLPLGIDPDVVYTTVSWILDPGERLVLFTDGLVEAASSEGEVFGRARLQSELREVIYLPLKDMVRELIARTSAHCAGADFEDDYTILGVERRTDGKNVCACTSVGP